LLDLVLGHARVGPLVGDAQVVVDGQQVGGHGVLLGSGAFSPILSCHPLHEHGSADTTAAGKQIPPALRSPGVQDQGMATVVSVNVGLPKAVAYETTSLPTTGIEKHPVEGPVRITF